MASNLQHFPQNSLIFWPTPVVAWLHLTATLTVQLKYSSPTVKRDSMPDELSVTLSDQSGAANDIQLRLAQQAVPNIPVYTLRVDEKGEYINHLEELEDNLKVAYYHDLTNDAVMQVTRINGQGDSEAHFQLKGELNYKGQKYSLNPDDRYQRESSPLSNVQSYTLLPQEPPRFSRYDHIPAPQGDNLDVVDVPPVDHLSNGQRRQASGVKSIVIDVAAVIDFARYNRFLASSPTKSAALQAIREYYAFIFSGVDLRYKGIKHPTYTISVHLVKVIVCEYVATSMFTEEYISPSSPLTILDAFRSLHAFQLFVKGSNLIFPSDHAMLFSGYDIVNNTAGQISKYLVGLAYIDTLCNKDGTSTSLVEDLGASESVVATAAHELAHSFSSLHDGDGNTCKDDDRFIMSPGYSPVTPANKLNSWVFSNCSIAHFVNFINQKLKTSVDSECLLGQLTVSGVPDIRSRLPGQEFSVDQQCQMIQGNGSMLCRINTSPSDTCTDMQCLNTTDNLCYLYPAAMGTTCGNGKICINGRCVSDPRAPSVDDDCVYGDPPGVAINGQTCRDYVNSYAGHCYDSFVKNFCCGSCKPLYRNVAGCEYGDKLTGCNPSYCRFYSASDRAMCCSTCGSGTTSANGKRESAITREEPISSTSQPLIQPAERQSAQIVASVHQD